MVKILVSFGLNYPGTSAELAGCHNDTNNMRLAFLRREFEIMLLCTDAASTPSNMQPTLDNMKRILKLVAKSARKGDTIVLHYSGHGTYVRDRSGEEKDGYDEALVPTDYHRVGLLTDDWLYDNFIAKLPEGCTLFGIMDCCHSGTSLDLPYQLQGGSASNGFAGAQAQRTTNRPSVKAKVYMVSGCRDDQTAADAWESVVRQVKVPLKTSKRKMRGFQDFANNRAIPARQRASTTTVTKTVRERRMRSSARAQAYEAQGAMSWAFLHALKNHRPPSSKSTFRKLLADMHTQLGTKYSQRPQLCMGSAAASPDDVLPIV